MRATSSTVIEDIQELHRSDPKKKLAYWYFQFSDGATQSVCNMIRSFIRQLSTSPLCHAIHRLSDHKRRSSDPDLKELAGALCEILDSLEHVFIVIDALDECPQRADRVERKKLLGFLRALLDNRNKNLHLLATSRPEYDIHSELGSDPALDIEKFMGNDISRYVKSAIWLGELNIWGDDIKHQMEEKLLSTEEK